MKTIKIKTELLPYVAFTPIVLTFFSFRFYSNDTIASILFTISTLWGLYISDVHSRRLEE